MWVVHAFWVVYTSVCVLTCWWTRSGAREESDHGRERVIAGLREGGGRGVGGGGGFGSCARVNACMVVCEGR